MTPTDHNKNEERHSLMQLYLRVLQFAVVLLFFISLGLAYWIYDPSLGTKKSEPLPVITSDENEAEEIEIVDGIHLPTGLVANEHLNVIRANCTACHSAKLITQNRATRDGWQEIIRWMQQTQKLWDLGDNEAVILDYLAEYYAPEESGRRSLLSNIDWYVLEQ